MGEREKYEVINILFYRASIAGKKRRAQIVNSRAFSARRACCPSGIKIPDESRGRVERERERKGGKHSGISSSAVRRCSKGHSKVPGTMQRLHAREKLRAPGAILDYYPLSPITYPRGAFCCNFLVSHDTDPEREQLFLPLSLSLCLLLFRPFVIVPVSRALDRRRSIPPPCFARRV